MVLILVPRAPYNPGQGETPRSTPGRVVWSCLHTSVPQTSLQRKVFTDTRVVSGAHVQIPTHPLRALLWDSKALSEETMHRASAVCRVRRMRREDDGPAQGDLQCSLPSHLHASSEGKLTLSPGSLL